MTISKKITIGVVLLFAGVLFLPIKAWADPTATLTIDTSGNRISYSADGLTDGEKYNVSLLVRQGSTSVEPSCKGMDTEKVASSSNISGSFNDSTAIELLTKDYSGVGSTFVAQIKVTHSGATDPVATSNEQTVYIGRVTADSGSSHLTISSSEYVISNNSNETYSSITVSANTEPYYIDTITVGGTSSGVKSVEKDLSSIKISEGCVVVKEAKLTPEFASAPSTIIRTGYTGTLNDLTLISDYSDYDFRIEDFSNQSAPFSFNPVYTGTSGKTLKITPVATDEGTAKAKINIYVSKNSGGTYVLANSYPIDINISPLPTQITITGDDKEVLKGTTAAYSYKLTPEGSTGTVTWSISSPASSDSSISGGTFTAGNTLGIVQIKATIDGTEISDTEDIRVVEIKMVEVSGANSTVAAPNNKIQYSATVKYDTGTVATKVDDKKVKWTTDAGADLAIIDETTGELTIKKAVTSDTKIHVTATSDIDSSKHDTKAVTLKRIARVTELKYKSQGITKDFKLDMAFGENTYVDSADVRDSISKIEWESDGSKTSIGTVSDKRYFEGKGAGTIDLTPTVYYKDGTSEKLTTKVVTITVYNPVTVESFDSNDGLKFTLPDKVYMNYSADNNISEVTGYRIDVLNKDGNSVYNSTTSTGSKSINLSGDTVENLIENATGNLSGDTHQVKLMISPVGKSQTNSGNTVTNSEENVRGISDTRTAYRVSVSGTNITSSAIYGLANHSVKITATPTSSTYKFAGWSDGNTSNPRTVTVSTNTSSNSYTATANTTGTPTSNAGNSSGGSKGSNSKLDKVPKTGESMAIYFIVMIAVISGCVAFATLFKSLTAKAAKPEYESSIDSWRGGEDGTGESHKK